MVLNGLHVTVVGSLLELGTIRRLAMVSMQLVLELMDKVLLVGCLHRT